MIPIDASDTALTTPRLSLSALTVEDADDMVGVLDDRRLHTFTGGQPDTLVELRDRYRRFVAGPADSDALWLNWIVRLPHPRIPIGTLQATVSAAAGPSPVADVGWIIGVAWQGHGYATEAVGAVVTWLTNQGVHQITAHIHPDHHASARVAHRAGFRPTPDLYDGETVWVRSGAPP